MIRKCSSKDVDDLVSLEQECFKSPLSYDFLKQEIEKNPLSNYLCFEKNGVVIGYIGLWLTDIGTILNLCVKEEYRRNNIASKLMDETIKVFKENNINEISLDVRVSNEKALSLYKKYNFKQVLIRKNYYENKEDAIVMLRSNV